MEGDIPDAVVVHIRGDVVGALFGFVTGIAHGNGYFDGLEHIQVIVTVTEGDGFLRGESVVSQHLPDSFGLAAVNGDHVHTAFVPFGVLDMGEGRKIGNFVVV